MTSVAVSEGLDRETLSWLNDLESAFTDSNRDFARAYYLFATARLEETFNSTEIYQRYPMLKSVETFQKMKTLYDAHPESDTIRRLFASVLDFYLGGLFSVQSDELENTRQNLSINVADLKLTDEIGKPIETLLYEDVYEWLKKTKDRDTRKALYDKFSEAHQSVIMPLFLKLFQQQNQMLEKLGYGDLIGFYSRSNLQNLPHLKSIAETLLCETQADYLTHMKPFYTERTDLTFEEAHRADIAFVFHGPCDTTKTIDAQFPQQRLVRLAEETFDQLGLAFSSVAREVNFHSLGQYTEALNQHDHRDLEESTVPEGVIWLDISHKPGKNARAYVYPARVGQEIYLSVKPEGGLDDYSAFLHESGHALHFAFETQTLPYSRSMLGNNSVTEAYAYLFQNLLLNRHWLVHQAGLTPDQAGLVVHRGALSDLYMLRRYCSKIRFEMNLYADPLAKTGAPNSLAAATIGKTYSTLLSEGTGFFYDDAGWSRDVDAGFYVADYFTAWTLETQLRSYLAQHYGTSEHHGEDWYQNPKAGAFLRHLWADGNLNPMELSQRLDYTNPNDTSPLLSWMAWNLHQIEA